MNKNTFQKAEWDEIMENKEAILYLTLRTSQTSDYKPIL